MQFYRVYKLIFVKYTFYPMIFKAKQRETQETPHPGFLYFLTLGQLLCNIQQTRGRFIQICGVLKLIIADFCQFWSLLDLLSHIAQNTGGTPPGLFVFSYTRIVASYYTIEIGRIYKTVGSPHKLQCHFWPNFAIFQSSRPLVALDEIFSTWFRYKSCSSICYEYNWKVSAKSTDFGIFVTAALLAPWTRQNVTEIAIINVFLLSIPIGVGKCQKTHLAQKHPFVYLVLYQFPE